MKLTVFILSILSWVVVKVASETCSKPLVKGSLLYIYQTADIDVTVYRCYFAGRHSYSDITKNCINAFSTGIFTDKWAVENYVNAIDSPVKLEIYKAKANLMQNEIRLRSGTVCRYDRGFCYDSQESTHFAVVWEVTHEKPDINSEDLIEIFYGYVDIWGLRNKNLTYLVFQDSIRDLSFSLRLVEQSQLDGKGIWYTDRHDMIVSFKSLKQNILLVPHLNQEYFPLKPKQFVSEQILRNCDLQNFPFNFERSTYQNYILDQNNLVAILNMFEKQLLETQKKLAVDDEENSVINKVASKLQNELQDTKTSSLAENQEMVEIRNTIQNMLNALSKKDSDISKLQENIEQIHIQQGNDDKVKERLIVIQNQLSTLDGDEKNIKKDIANLENNFTLLETTILEKNKEIFIALNNKDKLIDDIKNSLTDLYQELQNKDIKLDKVQENIFNRVINIELDLNRQKTDIIILKNYTNVILAQRQMDLKTNAKDIDKLELKHSDILAKLNVHDTEISKCQNHTTFLLSNKDKLLEETEDNVRKTQATILQLEEKISNLQNKENVLEQTVHDIDSKLKESVESEYREIIAMVNETKNEIKTVKEKSEQCRKSVDDILNSNNEYSKEIQRNLTDVQNVLFKQDDDILKLQEISKEIYDKLSVNENNFTEAISNYKHYVNTTLQTKEEVIKMQDNLIKKDDEIKNLSEQFKKMDERSKDFENKVNKCQDDIDKKLKEKDEEIKRIQNDLTIKDEEFRTELNKRDQEYKQLESEIKKIKEELSSVEVA